MSEQPPKPLEEWKIEDAKQFLAEGRPMGLVVVNQARSLPTEERFDRRQKILDLNTKTEMHAARLTINFTIFVMGLTDSELDGLIASIPNT